MGNAAHAGSEHSLSELLRDANLRRRTPTQAEIFTACSLEGVHECTEVSLRPNPVLSNRRVWLLTINHSPALSRTSVWSEPIASTTGRTVAAGLMSFWHRNSGICALRRRLHQQSHETRGPTRTVPRIFKNVSAARNWLLVCGKTGYIPSNQSGRRLSGHAS